MNSETYSGEVTLVLNWVNQLNGKDETKITLPVVKTENLSFYLETIFNQTLLMAQSLNPKFIPPAYVESKGSIELLHNGTRLCLEEYHIPIYYFETKGTETVEFFLNTRHCGSLFVHCAPDAGLTDDEHDTSGLHLLEFDFGCSTILDLKNKVVETVKGDVDFIYTESTLLVHPNILYKEPRLLRDLLGQCAEVKYKKKSDSSEIGIVAQMEIDSSSLASRVLFVNKQLTVNELEDFVNDLGATEDYLILQCSHLRLDNTLETENIDDGHQIYFDRDIPCGYVTTASLKFADVTKEPEYAAIENGKWTKPGKGLNFLGTCQTGVCEINQKGVSPLVRWKGASFDLNADIGKIVCPKCSNPLKIQTPAFHLIQWKYFGEKWVPENSESQGDGTESAHQTDLLTCDWRAADDANGYATFTVIDMSGIQFGLSEWKKLVIIIRPLPAKSKKSVKQEKYNVAVEVSLPLMFSVSFNFDWFRDFFN